MDIKLHYNCNFTVDQMLTYVTKNDTEMLIIDGENIRAGRNKSVKW